MEPGLQRPHDVLLREPPLRGLQVDQVLDVPQPVVVVAVRGRRVGPLVDVVVVVVGQDLTERPNVVVAVVVVRVEHWTVVVARARVCRVRARQLRGGGRSGEAYWASILEILNKCSINKIL